MLRLGDEVVLLNEQQIVGWRVRAVETFMMQTEQPIRLGLRLTVSGEGERRLLPPGRRSHAILSALYQEAEFDERIARLMQQARAIRDSISVSSRRTSRTTSIGSMLLLF